MSALRFITGLRPAVIRQQRRFFSTEKTTKQKIADFLKQAEPIKPQERITQGWGGYAMYHKNRKFVHFEHFRKAFPFLTSTHGLNYQLHEVNEFVNKATGSNDYQAFFIPAALRDILVALLILDSEENPNNFQFLHSMLMDILRDPQEFNVDSYVLPLSYAINHYIVQHMHHFAQDGAGVPYDCLREMMDESLKKIEVHRNKNVFHISQLAKQIYFSRLWFHSPLQKKIIHKCMQVECSPFVKKASTLLYRSSQSWNDTLRMEAKWIQIKSLSFGKFLLSGFARDRGACVVLKLFGNPNEQLDLSLTIVNNPELQRILSIPDSCYAQELLEYGEKFHPRTLVPKTISTLPVKHVSGYALKDIATIQTALPEKEFFQLYDQMKQENTFVFSCANQ